MKIVKVGYITDLNQREILGEMLLIELINKYNVNAVIIGGDCNLDPEDLPLRNKVKYYILSGDKDDVYVTKASRRQDNLLDGNIIHLNNIVVAGISGLDCYQTIVRLSKILNNMKKPRVDVLVTHHPPQGCLDLIESLGLRAGLGIIRKLVIKLRPAAVLTGHLRNRGVCYIGQSLVINPGPAEEGNYAILEFKNNGLLYNVSLNKLSKYESIRKC